MAPEEFFYATLATVNQSYAESHFKVKQGKGSFREVEF